jgi:hypothetical protein
MINCEKMPLAGDGIMERTGWMQYQFTHPPIGFRESTAN